MKPIDFFVWEKLKDGYLKKLGGRNVNEVYKEFRAALDKEKMPYEYLSACGWDDNSIVPTGRAQMITATLTEGSNEGFSISIDTQFQMGPRYQEQWVHIPIYRIKLLCGQDDALKVYAFVLKLLEHFR